MCLILFGSSSGNAADLADILHDHLRRRKLANVTIKPFGESDLAELQAHRHVFVICSTTGQGALPPNAQPFWSHLLKRSLTGPLLANVQLYSFGLGSSAYPRFNWATRKIHSRLLQLGAKEAIPRGEGDDIGQVPYESIFDMWVSMALSNLDSDLQITDVMETNELLPPLVAAKLSNGYTPPPSPSPSDRTAVLLPAKVADNVRITDASHFQDVRKLTIDVNTGGYEPGDVLCIYPANDDAIVDEAIASLEWKDMADHLLHVPPTYQAEGGWHYPLTLRNFLKWHIDLNSIPRRRFFALAQHFCSKTSHKERMQELATDIDDLFNYTSRPRRSIAEVIVEFDSLRIPIEYIVDLLPPLRPRQFSIASDPGSSNTVELAVAIVKYRTILRRVRRGTCTRWIEQLQPGDKIQVAIERNSMDLSKRIGNGTAPLFVATGTGIAPIRSLLYSLHKNTEKPRLFFGCRYENADFLFKDELKEKCVVIPAFSRQGGGYVQQQIIIHADEIDVENAFIFVCGASGSMPRAVRESFVECLVLKGYSTEEAEAIIRKKEKIGQYVQETW